MTTMSLRNPAVLRFAVAAAGAVLAGFGCSAQSDQPTGLNARNPSLLVSGASQQYYSGQRVFGADNVVEPAVDDANGSTIFLLTPSHVPGVPFPSISNPVAAAPMYLPVYPATSTIDPSTLDCQPTNCDHVNVLPFPAPGYPNGGQTCVQYGFPAGGCALLLGHDHLVGVASTGGDFNVAWNVILIVFTPKGITDGASNRRAMTLSDVQALEANGEAFPAQSGITFNCSITSISTYLKGTPIVL